LRGFRYPDGLISKEDICRKRLYMTSSSSVEGRPELTAGQYASRARLKTIILDKISHCGALAYSSRLKPIPDLQNRCRAKNFSIS
jgi:hypothetical protein